MGVAYTDKYVQCSVVAQIGKSAGGDVHNVIPYLSALVETVGKSIENMGNELVEVPIMQFSLL